MMGKSLLGLCPPRVPFNGKLLRQISRSESTTSHNVPPSASKVYIDTRPIWRNPKLYSQNCLERNYQASSEHPFKIVQLIEERIKIQRDNHGLWRDNKIAQSKLSQYKSVERSDTASQDVEGVQWKQLLEEAQEKKETLAKVVAQEQRLSKEINRLAAELPNLTSNETPRGDDPKILRYVNKDPEHPEPLNKDHIRDHVYIGKYLNILDFEGPAATSGWGWCDLDDEAADLERALIEYALDVAKRHQFRCVTPSSMVYSHINSRCGFRPRDQNGEQQVYHILKLKKGNVDDESIPGHSLAATAEIPFASKKANKTIDKDYLPLRIVGPSRCFRAEAGARGAATKGLYRLHEFTKVEMFAWTLPGMENEVFDSMVAVQTEILQSLGLWCRVLEMPSSDLGASAYRKIDIEAYFPSRRKINDGWGEVTSASICTDYQTRRLNTRYDDPDEKSSLFPYTVNATALAVPRVLAALLENGWNDTAGPGGFVMIPEVLWPYMRGVKRIITK